MTATAIATAASALQADDVFVYGGERQRVLGTTVAGSVAGGDLIEVATIGVESGQERFLDYASSETVDVIDGPSAEVVPVAVVAAIPASVRAMQVVRGKALRSLPTSAALVLYAVAACEDDGISVPSLSQIASAAGLAESTTRGHLGALVQRGVLGARFMGWIVTA